LETRVLRSQPSPDFPNDEVQQQCRLSQCRGLIFIITLRLMTCSIYYIHYFLQCFALHEMRISQYDYVILLTILQSFTLQIPGRACFIM
jgi:hypothetical protein